jgi:hypothetical protein
MQALHTEQHQNAGPASSGVHVRVLRTLGELEECRAAWSAWPGHRDSRLDFYLAVLRSNRETERPHVIVIYRDGRPDAMLVGRLDHGQIDFRIGYIHFRRKADILYFVYGALRGNGSIENCEVFINEIRRSLSNGEADLAYLNFLKVDSKLHQLARKTPGKLGRDHLCVTQPHFSASIPGSAKQFYATLSAKARKHAKTRDKKITTAFAGGLSVRCFRSLAEIEELIEHVEQVAAKSYQRGLGVGFQDCAGTRERLLLEASKGWLRAYVLYVAGLPTAFWIGDLHDGTFMSDYLGFDPALANYSPGMYLITQVIEGFCNDGKEHVAQVDFSIGQAQYKAALANNEWSESAIYIYGPSWKGLRLKLLKLTTGVVQRAVQQTLGHTLILQKIKKIWRARLTPNS